MEDEGNGYHEHNFLGTRLSDGWIFAKGRGKAHQRPWAHKQ